jgi:hypothetical protein
MLEILNGLVRVALDIDLFAQPPLVLFLVRMTWFEGLGQP